MTDFSDEELERKMRQKLFADCTPKSANPLASMSEAERRMTEKLVGRDNAERLAKHKGVGRFRPAPVNVHYEWWWAEGDYYSRGSYHIARIENGRQVPHWQGFSKHELDKEIALLNAKDFRVSRFRLSGEPGELELKKAGTSAPKSTLNKLSDFKLKGR